MKCNNTYKWTDGEIFIVIIVNTYVLNYTFSTFIVCYAFCHGSL